MKNIKINKATRECTPNEVFIGIDRENLQETVEFTFDEFVDGIPRLEFELYNGSKAFISDITKSEKKYVLVVKSILANYDIKYVQLVITGVGTNPPVFKTEKMKFIVESSINADEEADPDEYISWIDMANEKLEEIDDRIEEVDNLNITGEKVGHVATITITDKEGVSNSIQIEDGSRGEQGEVGPPGIQGVQGVGISNVAKTSTEGLVDTYTITYTNDNTSTFDVTNGRNGTDGFSPIANVTRTGSVVTIRITDINGTTEQNVTDPDMNNYYTIPDIDNMVSGLNDDIDDINDTIGDINDDIDDINNTIGDINTILASLTTPVNNGGN